MHTTIFLVRNAQTAWNDERRLAGRRELGLSEQGRATAAALVVRFAGVELGEILTSPLPRAVETAQPLAAGLGLDVARDPRLIDWQPGRWEGRTYAEIAVEPLYATLMSGPPADAVFPDGDRLLDVRNRMRSAVAQALQDNELGSSIALVSHAGPLRLLLAHYLSIAASDHTRLRLEPGSVTVLRFTQVDRPPELIAINVCGRVLDSLKVAR